LATPTEVAAYLQVPVRTLYAWRYQTVHRPGHLFRDTGPMSRLRIAGGIHQRSWEQSPGSGPAERGQRETPGQGYDRNKCTLQAALVSILLIKLHSGVECDATVGLKGVPDPAGRPTRTRVSTVKGSRPSHLFDGTECGPERTVFELREGARASLARRQLARATEGLSPGGGSGVPHGALVRDRAAFIPGKAVRSGSWAAPPADEEPATVVTIASNPPIALIGLRAGITRRDMRIATECSTRSARARFRCRRARGPSITTP
jgi:hypothetical protein